MSKSGLPPGWTMDVQSRGDIVLRKEDGHSTIEYVVGEPIFLRGAFWPGELIEVLQYMKDNAERLLEEEPRKWVSGA